MKVEQCQVIADPHSKPTNFGQESGCRLLSSIPITFTT